MNVVLIALMSTINFLDYLLTGIEQPHQKQGPRYIQRVY